MTTPRPAADLARIAAASLLVLWGSGQIASAQQPKPPVNPSNSGQPQAGQRLGGGEANVFMQVPVSGLFPGAIANRPNIKNPVAGDPAAPERGMKAFQAFNCIGCHADNGGGGIGPSLSNHAFIYGSQPGNIFLSIYQGRPNGMPAWGSVLPQAVIWDLVTYVQHLSNAPSTQWGTTTSATSPAIEQVPAEFVTSPIPWSRTQPFRSGQKPH